MTNRFVNLYRHHMYHLYSVWCITLPAFHGHNILIYSISHIAEVAVLSDWILDIYWLRNSDQSVGVSSIMVYLIISHTVVSYQVS